MHKIAERTVVTIFLGISLLLASCVADTSAPTNDLFPPQVGDFLRTSGPAPDPVTGVDQSTYQGGSGNVTIRIRRVGAGQIDHALSELPLTATDVGYDAALGQREGLFFTFGEEFHAAWGNGDWVFVLSAGSPSARVAFLNAYGY